MAWRQTVLKRRLLVVFKKEKLVEIILNTKQVCIVVSWSSYRHAPVNNSMYTARAVLQLGITIDVYYDNNF